MDFLLIGVLLQQQEGNDLQRQQLNMLRRHQGMVPLIADIRQGESFGRMLLWCAGLPLLVAIAAVLGAIAGAVAGAVAGTTPGVLVGLVSGGWLFSLGVGKLVQAHSDCKARVREFNAAVASGQVEVG